jgi:hypothetical protein
MAEMSNATHQIAITEKCCGDHVAAGFMPAFKLQPEIVLVMKRGHKARGYEPVLTLVPS